MGQWLVIADNNAEHVAKMVKLIRKTIDSAMVCIDQARRAWHEERREDAAHIFHTMRGSVGTLGAKRFVNASYAIEKALLENDVMHIPALFEQVEQELVALVSAAETWLARHSVR